MFALFDAAVRAGYHILTSVISVLSPLFGGLAGAAALVAVTIALRLPLLAQWPFFSVLYRLFLTPVISGHTNALLSDQLLGVPLGSRWLAGAGPFSAHGAVFLGLFALIALVSWAAVRLARRFTAAP